MDLGTLIGLIASIIVVLVAILIGSSIVIFINIPSILIVLGGTVGVTLIKWPLSTIVNSFKIAIMTALFDKSESPREMIDLATEISRIVQKEGVLALENYPIKNKFLSKGINLVVDGHDPDFIKQVLQNEMNKSIKESDVGKKLFEGIGESAPAMGMIGTLVGLVQMLATMDDPNAIGPAMAVALLTTLYGSLIAQVFALPIAEKLAKKSAREKDMMSLIIESVFSIQIGQNPRVMSELLETFLSDDEDKSVKKKPAS